MPTNEKELEMAREAGFDTDLPEFKNGSACALRLIDITVRETLRLIETFTEKSRHEEDAGIWKIEKAQLIEMKWPAANTIISAQLNSKGELEVIRRFPSNMAYCSGEPFPDKVVKEIYRAELLTVKLAEEIVGRHPPAYTVPEKIESK